jgi:SAM-dependent methyltransferase
VAIQAMRIIAIGTEGTRIAPPAQKLDVGSPIAAEVDLGRPYRSEPGDSQPESSAPEIETAEIASRDTKTADSAGDLSAMPALPEAALQDIPPLPEAALQDAPSPPSPDEAPEPLGLELFPLQPDEKLATADPDDTDATPQQLVAPVEAAPDIERAPESVEVLDPESQPATRKRPPPPRRISMPSSPGETQAPTPDTRDRSVPEQAVPLQPPPIAAVELAPRQPPPAPSRVPRDLQPSRAMPKPEPPERSRELTPVSGIASSVGSEPPEKPKARPRRPWWEELFGEDFSRATVRLSDAQVDQEVSFIEESLGVAKGAAVLDLGCGAGHHAVELASRGYGVVGYDLSLHQLALAQEVAQDRGQKLNFMQGDMREMAFEEVFDGMYCWNTAFGYFEEDKNIVVAERMFAALKPGGTLLLDVANREFVSKDQPSSVWYEGDSCVCMDDMTVDFFTSRLRVKRSLILDDGRTRECHYSIRLYSLHELGRILHDVGFRVTEASGHPATPGVFLGLSSPRIIVLAQKP